MRRTVMNARELAFRNPSVRSFTPSTRHARLFAELRQGSCRLPCAPSQCGSHYIIRGVAKTAGFTWYECPPKANGSTLFAVTLISANERRTATLCTHANGFAIGQIQKSGTECVRPRSSRRSPLTARAIRPQTLRPSLRERWPRRPQSPGGRPVRQPAPPPDHPR